MFCCFVFSTHVEYSVPLYIHLIYLHTYLHCFYCTRHDTFYYAKNRYIYILYLNKHMIHIISRRRSNEQKKKAKTSTITAKI